MAKLNEKDITKSFIDLRMQNLCRLKIFKYKISKNL